MKRLGAILLLGAALVGTGSPLDSAPAVQGSGTSTGVPSARASRLGSDRMTFESEEGPEGLLFTVRADKVPVDLLMDEAARALGRRLVGFEEASRAALVDAHLTRRPAFEAIEAVLGSVGLEARIQPGVLVVEESRPGQWTQPELLEQASAAYALAMRKHPEHLLASGARLAQGGIEEERGNWNAALAHYETILEEFRSSPEVYTARMRAAMALQRMGLWRDASAHLQILSHSNTPLELGVDARFELARCAEEVGDHERSLSVLSALDSHSPATTTLDITRRQLLSAQASIGLHRHIDALRLLDRSESIGLTAEQRDFAHGLRAQAFEGLEMYGEASRAWLVFSRTAKSEERALALENAARLCALDGDNLGVLFVFEQAARDGLDARLTPFAREARTTLGLSPRLRLADSPENRLDVAIHRVSIEEFDAALELLEPLFKERATLFHATRIRTTTTLADALAGAKGVEQALSVLAMAREEALSPSDIAALDLHAAQLLEDHQRYDDAVEAYRGNY